jgi:hypothetical protein
MMVYFATSTFSIPLSRWRSEIRPVFECSSILPATKSSIGLMETDFEALLGDLDGTALARYLRSFASISEIPPFFDPLHDQSRAIEFLPKSPLTTIFSTTIPVSLFLTLSVSPSFSPPPPYPQICSPYQTFILTLLKGILAEHRGQPHYPGLLSDVATALLPVLPPRDTAIRLCAPVDAKHVGVFSLDGVVSLYLKTKPTSVAKTVPPGSFVSEIPEWEITIAEREFEAYSETQAVFRSIGLCHELQSLPIVVYEAILNYITSPTLQFISAVLDADITGVERALATVIASQVRPP